MDKHSDGSTAPLAGADGAARARQIVAMAMRLLNAPIVVLALRGRDGRFAIRAMGGLEPEQTAAMQEFLDHVRARLPEPAVIADMHQDPRFWSEPLVQAGPSASSCLEMPFRNEWGEPLALLCAFDPMPNAFDSADLRVVEDLLQICSRELQHQSSWGALSDAQDAPSVAVRIP